MLANIVSSMANDFRLRSGDRTNSITVVWITEDDSFPEVSTGERGRVGLSKSNIPELTAAD